MADIRTQPVVEDLGSEEVKKLRFSFNAFLDAFGTFLDSLEAAAAIGDVSTAATTFLAEIETDLAEIKKIVGEPGNIERPSRPVY